jgi:hypothetical protein
VEGGRDGRAAVLVRRRGRGAGGEPLQLDTAATLAWIGAVVGLLLAVEYLLLEPIKREVERWREVAA